MRPGVVLHDAAEPGAAPESRLNPIPPGKTRIGTPRPEHPPRPQVLHLSRLPHLFVESMDSASVMNMLANDVEQVRAR